MGILWNATIEFGERGAGLDWAHVTHSFEWTNCVIVPGDGGIEYVIMGFQQAVEALTGGRWKNVVGIHGQTRRVWDARGLGVTCGTVC